MPQNQSFSLKYKYKRTIAIFLKILKNLDERKNFGDERIKSID